MKSGKSMSIHDITRYTFSCCLKKFFFSKVLALGEWIFSLCIHLERDTYEISLLDGPGASVVYLILRFKLAVSDNS